MAFLLVTLCPKQAQHTQQMCDISDMHALQVDERVRSAMKQMRDVLEQEVGGWMVCNVMIQ